MTGIRIGHASEDRVTAFIPRTPPSAGRRVSPARAWPWTGKATCMRRRARYRERMREVA